MTPSTHEPRRSRRDKRPPVVEPPVLNGRVPPHDLDAEAAALSACLLDSEALDVSLEMLEPEDFYSEANTYIFEACRDLSRDSKPVDNVTVASWLRTRELINKIGGTQYLGRITGATPAIANVAEHAQTVIDKKRIRLAQSVCHNFAGTAYGDPGMSTQEFLDELEHNVYDVARARDQSDDGLSLKDALTVTFKALQEQANEGRVSGIRSGFTDLDQKIAGLNPGDLLLIAGRPGMAKTSAALNIAVHAAAPETLRIPDPEQGHPIDEVRPGYVVPIFSLEMPKEQVATRLVCAEGRVDIGKLRQGRLSQDDWASLTSAAAALADLPIHIDDTAGLNLFQLRAKLRRIAADDRRRRPDSPGLGPVIIDYLQLMSGTGRDQSREQEVSKISRGLKEIAKEFKVPVIALSQLNRGVETRGGKDKRPMLSDLRESGALEQDSDTVIFLYRDEYYHPEETTDRGIAELIIAKQRNGPTGTVRMRFVSSCTRFENLAPGQYQEFGEFG
jgi:replicative DNA helicase